MKTRITERDWEILSAYLDGELNTRDTARLESRLQSNPDLRDALTELRRTRALLRSQPRLRAPRNFTLTPETAGIRRPSQPVRRLSPVFGMVSAFASFVLIVMILGEVMTGNPTAVSREVSSAPATYSQAVERMAEATAEGAIQPEEAPQVLMEQAQPPVGAAEAPMDTTGKAVPMEAETPGVAGANKYPAPAVLSQMSMTVTGTLGLTEELPEATPIASAPTAGLDVSANEAAAEVIAVSQPEQRESFWNAWRTAELALLLLGIAAALIAIRLRRTGN